MTTSNTPAVRLTPATSANSSPAGGRALGWLAVAGIFAAILIMIGADLVRGSWMPPTLAMPHPGPPWELTAHVSVKVVAVALWLAALMATGGVVAGLVAARRGLPLPVRTLVTGGLIAVAALAVLPPVGSTDTLDYAIYGQIAALGHSPYVMTPAQYGLLVHLHHGVPLDWRNAPSVYGPLATGEQLAAAKLSGTSLARTVFWLKLCNVITFVAVAFAADRLLRADRASRLRAHVLWTANPLIIWSVIAAGHLDLLAAGVGLAGLLLIDRWTTGPPLPRALAAGLCVGAAADIKASFALFGLAIAWALRRKPGQLLVAAGGALAVLVPSYLIAGTPALKALTTRASTGFGYGFYGFFFHRLGISLSAAVPVAVCLMIPVAWLAFRGLPPGFGDRPAVRAAVALSAAWLLVWPHQFAWYSVMLICVLVWYPASRLDWIALAWLSMLTIADIPGLGTHSPIRLGPALRAIQTTNLIRLGPVVMLGALVAFVALCITRRWHAARVIPDHG